MKKLFMIGFVFISTLSFADSGSLSLNFGDGHRGGADVAVSLNIGDEHPRYVEKEVYIYEQPKYVQKEVVHVYEQPRYVQEQPKYNKKHKKRCSEPQKVVVVHKYEEVHHHNAPYGQAKKYSPSKGYNNNNNNNNWKN